MSRASSTLSDELMCVALDWTTPFTARDLSEVSGVHHQPVGSWLVNQVVNGNLVRTRVDGTWQYEWTP